MRSQCNWKPLLSIGLAASAWLATGHTARADSIRVDVKMGTPVMLEKVKKKAYLKVGLAGLALRDKAARTPVNVAIVLDRSGSMTGEKIRKAREAAIMAIERLNSDDIVSVVAYNHTVDVLVPATRVRERGDIYRRVNRLFADGNTALFAGVAKGAHEVRKFIERNRVNRVILLSDGLANVGPSSPGELGDLGWSLSKEGVSVTTIGLGKGYNEDLMVALAAASDGNHAFAEDASDLARIFSREFGDVLSVVARDVRLRIRCVDGVRPVRILGRRGEINGTEVVATLNQVYADQEKFILVELSVPARGAGTELEVARVEVSYANTVSRTTDTLKGKAVVRFSRSRADVERNQDNAVMVHGAELIANEENKRAVALRDQGKTRQAKQVLEKNVDFLERNAEKYRSPKLKRRARSSRQAGEKMDKRDWATQRKRMRKEEFMLDMQQAW